MPQIANSRETQATTILKHPQARIALDAQDPTNLTRLVIVIHSPGLEIESPSTDRTTTSLLFQELFELCIG
jgi:hypothetical protein